MIETEGKQELTHGGCSSVVSKSVPPLIYVPSYHWDLRCFKSGSLSTRFSHKVFSHGCLRLLAVVLFLTLSL